eukprot:g40214.t1
MGVNVTEDLQELKSHQASLFASEASKVIFHSRVYTSEQDETCLHFFFQKVHKERSVLSSLKEEDGLCQDRLPEGVGNMVGRGQGMCKILGGAYHQVTRAIFHFIRRSKLDCVCWDTVSKALDKVGKNVPNAALILMVTLVCGCIKLCIDPRYADTKCYYDSVLYRLFPGIHTETNISCAWRTINSVKDALWSAQNVLVFQSKELTPTKCCRLAHSKVQDYVLRDALMLGEAATTVQICCAVELTCIATYFLTYFSVICKFVYGTFYPSIRYR